MRAIKMLVAALALQGAIEASAQTVQLLHPTNAVWRYQNDLATQQAAAADWITPSFDDSTWLSGNGLFGNEANYPYPMNTTLPGGLPVSVYYRTHFTWSGTTAGVVLTGTNYVDDGSIIFLNGVEIARFNMVAAAGAATPETQAPVANPGGFPNVNAGEPVLVRLAIDLDALTNGNVNPLIAGDNVVAVTVAQAGVGSSDRVFGLALYGAQAIAPCFSTTPPIQPTNRIILVGRSTTFTAIEQCGVPAPALQWYRDIGAGEELITGATAATYTLTNAATTDSGVYYVKATNSKGTATSRQATLTVSTDGEPPKLLSGRLGANNFEIVVTADEPLCPDDTCSGNASLPFNWEIFVEGDENQQLGIAGIVVTGNIVTFALDGSTPWVAGTRYTIRLQLFGAGSIGDLFGNLLNGGDPFSSVTTLSTVSFQQGANGYAGTQDAEIHSNAQADTALGTLLQMGSDLDDAGIAQSLLRFDNIFGPDPGQIPSGAIIRSATLTLNQIDPGSAINLHRMLVGWDQATVTWNTMNNGVTADDVEAAVAVDATKAAGVANGAIALNVTATVQAWAAGAANHGWAFLSTGTDGWDANTSESASTPLLTVEYEVVPCAAAPTIASQPPAATSVNEGQAVSIPVGVNAGGTCELTFEWLKGSPGTVVPGQNTATLSIPSAVPADAGTYRLRVSNVNGSVTSDPVVLTVVGDTTRPVLTRAAGPNNTTVVLTFSKAMGATAGVTGNYTVSGATVSAANVAGNVVTLTTSARSAGNSTVTITGVRDTRASANLIDPNPTTFSLTTVSKVINWGDAWEYNTNNLDSASPGWRTTGGAGWLSGNGLFGTETSAGVVAIMPTPIATVIPPPNTNNEFMVSYFRKSITLPALGAGQSYAIGHITDDGLVAYLDGVEIGRFNMPAGQPTYATNAVAGIEGALLALPFTATAGAHTLAIEVHQNANTSSDMLFGAEVIIVPTAAPALTIVHSGTNAFVSWNADSSWTLVGSTNVAGPYTAVGGAGRGSFSRPIATPATQFYKLNYVPQP